MRKPWGGDKTDPTVFIIIIFIQKDSEISFSDAAELL